MKMILKAAGAERRDPPRIGRSRLPRFGLVRDIYTHFVRILLALRV